MFSLLDLVKRDLRCLKSFCSSSRMSTSGSNEEAFRKSFEDGTLRVVQTTLGGINQVFFEEFPKHRRMTYSGEEGPGELVRWLREMEKIMHLGKTPDCEKVVQATDFLEGKASKWCRQVKTSHPEVDYSWDDLKFDMIEKYIGFKFQWQKEKEFMEITMGEGSLHTYTMRYQALSMFGQRFVTTEESLTVRYIGRMSPELRSAMSRFDNTTFAEAYGRATVIWEFQRSKIREGGNKRKAMMSLESETSVTPNPPPQYPNLQKQRLLNFITQTLLHQPTILATHQPFKVSEPSVNPSGDPHQTTTLMKCQNCYKTPHSGWKCNGQLIICYNCQNPGTPIQ
ncbi:hypothetical protein RND81_09G001600 [Saponaria officinalis]|uniref:Retrotransposon gag domain-containing protein n=1 Tax=Saponaria officinalis TaxID=3572 RepID=A0AAW1IH00_SAPOF